MEKTQNQNQTKKPNYTANDRAIVAALQGADHPLTFAEIKVVTGLPLVPGQITSALKKKLIVNVGKVKVLKSTKRSACTYELITSEPTTKITSKGEVANAYSESEVAIMRVLADAQSPITLAAIANALGLEKLSSGAINGLVKKNNVRKCDKIVVVGTTQVPVGVYGVADPLPDSWGE